MNEHITELVETLDALLSDLRRAGCHLVCVVATPEPDGCGIHLWRGGNPAILYSILEIIVDELHDQLVALVRGENDDTE